MSYTEINYLLLTNEDWQDALCIEDKDGPVDLAGSSFRAEVRTTEDSLAVALVASTKTGNERLLIAGVDAPGVVSWNVSKETLKLLAPGTYVYDLQWTLPDAHVDTIVGGTITIKRGITRE